MQATCEICSYCPVKDTCDPSLIPIRSNGKKIVVYDPWLCRHLTCPAGVDQAKLEIRKLRFQKTFADYAYFSSPDKPSVRRVNIRTGVIESEQNGQWYSIGQSIHRTYLAKRAENPLARIRG